MTGCDPFYWRTTAISGWREKKFYVNTPTTAIPLHGLVRRYFDDDACARIDFICAQ
jgi:hypothetical protein